MLTCDNAASVPRRTLRIGAGRRGAPKEKQDHASRTDLLAKRRYYAAHIRPALSRATHATLSCGLADRYRKNVPGKGSGARRAVDIVTDRDLVLQAMANGRGPADVVVGDVMSQGLAAVKESADVFEAIETMRTCGVRRLAVADANGALLGVISRDDVVAALGVELGGLASVVSTELKAEREQGQRAPVIITIG